MNEALTLAMLGILALGIFSGFPVSMVLAGTGFLGFIAAVWMGTTDFGHLGLIYLRIRGVLTNEGIQFTSVPMLIFLGLLLNSSGISDSFFRLVGTLLRKVPGRHAIATLIVGLILAPATGVIGASVITVALVAYDPMLKSGYPPRTAGAAVAASGALGVIFPPAILLFFVASHFQLRLGMMYAALVVPVALMVLLFAAWFAFSRVGHRQADHDAETGLSAPELLTSLAAVAVIASIPLSIVGGLATLSEAAGVGLFGAIVVLGARRLLSVRLLSETMTNAASMTSMVFFIVIGAMVFSLGFNLVGGPDVLFRWITEFALGRWDLLVLLLTVVTALGFFFDWMEILLVFLPILQPVFDTLQFSDHVGSPYMANLWMAALVALALQTSFLTPPFGYALFFARMAAPRQVQLADIYWGAVPLVLLEILLIALLMAVPELITWLPGLAPSAVN
ncbi:TRAP transporter large permease subunit [Rhodobacterales bacterium HKCCE3408]|nr:TRAP transporter large permease subunit [Rhodobacterales bacterium HKCCE3408]